MADDVNALETLSYDQFCVEAADQHLTKLVTHVGTFTYVAQTNFLGGWSDEKERRVTFLIQRTLQDALEASGFHNLAYLETRRFSDGVEFRYGDPDFGFTYSIDGRGRIVLSRQRSSASAFHDWYRKFMPSLTHIILRTVETIDDEMTGFSKDEAEKYSNLGRVREPVIQVERAAYNFSVAVELNIDESHNQGPVLPNIQVLNRALLSRVPSASGALTDPLTVVPEEFGRMDYHVSRWSPANKVLEQYKISAPSYNRWRLLMFDFAYVGDTYIPSAGDREPFNQKKFITGETTSDAYLEFFRQRCISGFMRDVLYGDRGRRGLSSVGPDDVGTFFSTSPSW